MQETYSQSRHGMASFRCDPEIITQTKAISRSIGCSFSDAVRQALALFIKQAKLPDSSLIPVKEEALAEAAPPCEEEPLVRDKDLHHNIAFLKRAEHGYQGFRFTITRRKHTCRLHFSANDYGSATAALDAAITVRNYVEKELAKRAEEYIQIFEEARLKALSLKQPRK